MNGPYTSVMEQWKQFLVQWSIDRPSMYLLIDHKEKIEQTK